MCPLRPCSNPSAVGVFVRDTASWIAYSPQATEKILAGYSETLGLSVSDLLAGELGAKDGEPGSPRSVLPGAPRASPSSEPGRVDLGSLGLGGGAYVVDIVAGTQVSPRGFARPVLFVFPDARSRERFARALEAGDAKCECAVAAGDAERSKEEQNAERLAPTAWAQIAANTKKEDAIKASAKLAATKAGLKKAWAVRQRQQGRERRLAAAAAELRAKEEEENKAKEVLGKVRKVLDANRHAVHAVATKYARAKVSEVTLDTESPHVKRFVELASSDISGDPDIVLGYHGTSVDRAEAIVTGGFCPTKRVAALGAYFSGVPEESYQHAGKHDSRGSILLVALIRDGYKGANSSERTPDSLRRLAGGDVVSERVAAFEEYACLPLVHVRGVC
ncbi:hypothetical protein MICPUN_113775 [Micromonas commoda]|uniref:PARP catalytic domain-containing protein n=1 Tax=Micromonas commoda (strain RCC299 / NOUM17 / CCMP2709) TaxID=296587 RepID=C1FI53_MICCC|nr:hypothetical protein MICPUN_113775 [Micromonas commoda]ACO69663.1 hypothetical protein MICPUN_113775 [Micromonas commoda]|eukprot:XP_002508405.1 hypothetical protein MICPUN_113775 [Micromonas commoda]